MSKASDNFEDKNYLAEAVIKGDEDKIAKLANQMNGYQFRKELGEICYKAILKDDLKTLKIAISNQKTHSSLPGFLSFSFEHDKDKSAVLIVEKILETPNQPALHAIRSTYNHYLDPIYNSEKCIKSLLNMGFIEPELTLLPAIKHNNFDVVNFCVSNFDKSSLPIQFHNSLVAYTRESIEKIKPK